MTSSSDFSSPYNITITNDSPVVNYSPYRDGLSTSGWNFTCTESVDSTWVASSFCVGSSSHRSSFIGATLTIDFEGTAAYLYGTATSGSYAISIDGQTSTSFTAGLSSGLLGKSIGMDFGKHTLELSVTQSSLVSFSEAILTVGVGRGDSINNVQNRTLSAFIQSSAGTSSVNPQFSYVGTWGTQVPGPIGYTSTVTYPRQDTDVAGSYMTFTISQASALFVYSLVNFDHGQFSVIFTPPPSLGQPVTTTYDGNSHWISLDRLLFWAAGMDRDQQYTVQITNMGTGSTPYLDFSHVEVVDATSIGPLPTSATVTSSSSTGFPTASPATKPTPGTAGSVRVKHGVSVGGVVGGILGALLFIFILVIGCICYRRRRRPIPRGPSPINDPRHTILSQSDGAY